MSTRKQPRRIARELALLGLSQLKSNSEKLEQQQINDLLVAATRTLTAEIKDILESASAELRRGNDRLLESDIYAQTVIASKTMVQDAITLAETAINRLGTALELPIFLSLADQFEVRKFALDIISAVHRRKTEIDQLLEEVLEDWQLKRLPRIDQDILRIATAEICYLEVPQKIAINEAIEMAKTYSDEEGHRFINGVLRRLVDRIAKTQKEETPINV